MKNLDIIKARNRRNKVCCLQM